MRKILIIAVLAFTGLQLSNAQEIGARFGNIVGNNVAIDFAWAFSTGRIHADVSFGNGVGVEALYDFLYGSLGDPLGIDWRPTFAILQNTNFHADRFGLNLRFVI